jgi:hypothetical protein
VALNLGISIGGTPLGATDGPAVDHLLELLDRPAWQRDALCREYGGDVNFFPGRGESLELARALCAACLVRPECQRGRTWSSWRVTHRPSCSANRA